MPHSDRFVKISQDATSRIQQTNVQNVQKKLSDGDDFVLIDVREDHEWAKGHISGAQHLGKGIIERDIEKLVSDTSSEIVLYCGGGHRSALAADALQKMGYENVWSMAGGYRAWVTELPKDI